jgi:UMF1 family MFS transporter
MTRTENRRAVWGWAFYDFANSSFTTLVVTFIYATYFTKGIASDENTGTMLWSRAVTVTALIVAFLSPYVGIVADQGGYRKRFLLLTTAITIAGTVALFIPQRGDVVLALVLFTVTNIAYEMSNVFYNAFLPTLAPPQRIGRISGFGWALGYGGGLLCLVVALVTLVRPDPPWFGLSAETDAPVRAANLLTALWFAVFALPMFLWVQDRRPTAGLKWHGLIQSANRQLIGTFREIRDRYRQIFRLLVARLIYNDGLITIFAFGGIYAQGTFGFTTQEIIVFGIALNVAAGLGALAFGLLDDRLGGKITILISLAGLLLVSAIAVVAPNRLWFWIAAIGVGVLAGPVQSASRSLMGRFVPPAKENEFYGFFAFSGKATAFLGPLMLGQLTQWFDSQRAGVASVILFFIVGGLLLLRVDEQEGIRLAARSKET